MVLATGAATSTQFPATFADLCPTEPAAVDVYYCSLCSPLLFLIQCDVGIGFCFRNQNSHALQKPNLFLIFAVAGVVPEKRLET